MRKLLSKPTGGAASHHQQQRHDEAGRDGNRDGSRDSSSAGTVPISSPADLLHHQHSGHHGTHSPHPRTATASPISLLYHSSSPQEATFQVGVPIASLDKSPDGRLAVLAGRHVLKTVVVNATDIREAFDLRALITAQTSPLATSNLSIAEQLAVSDVKWGRGRNDTHIFTACLRGKIFQYDLSCLGTRVAAGGGAGNGGGGTVDYIQTQEGTRQVNTLDINPHKDVYLLSGSQDGVVRCFDTRNLVPSRLGSAFKQMQVFKCNADVRDVKWSPKQGFYFACCTEQGAVMKWDIRKPSAPVLRVAGHEKACASISWHPDGEHLVSGGVDKKCYVWDMSRTADKRQKPKWTISTPASVAAVAWRPGQWSATLQGLRAAQIAVSYDVTGPKRPGINAAHVWDLARPTMPFKTIERFEFSPSALLWKDAEFLWTAGEDGMFCQNDVHFSPRVLDRVAVSTLSFSSCGDVLTFLDERAPPSMPRTLPSAAYKDLPSAVSTSFGSDPATPTLSMAMSMNRSDSEDDVVRSFLIPRRRLGRKRRASSLHMLSSTPPSILTGSSGSGVGGDGGTGIGSNTCVPLTETLRATGTFRPQQIMAIGRVPSAARKDAYGYLAKIYLETLEDGLPAMVRNGVRLPLPERVTNILDTYARAAENVNQFRLAQVWRIIAFAMDLLFRNRGQYHRDKRLAEPQQPYAGPRGPKDSIIHRSAILYTNPSGTTLESMSSNESSAGDSALQGSDKQYGSHKSGRTRQVRSLLTEEIESTSNMSTPLARPVSGMAYLGEKYQQPASGHGYLQHAGFGSGGLPSDIDTFDLPPAQYHEYLAGQPAHRHVDSTPSSETSQTSHGSGTSHVSNVEGYDFYDTESMAKAIDVPHATSRSYKPPPTGIAAHRGSQNHEQYSPVRTQFQRQDSTDSAAGRIFDISQASGHALDDTEGIIGGSGSSPMTTFRGRERYPPHEARGRQDSEDSLTDDFALPSHGRPQSKPLVSSMGSSRLLRLNKALLSMEWSGTDLASGIPNIHGDTYYRTTSQDTESSNNSFSHAQRLSGTSAAANERAGDYASTTKPMRPSLRRGTSSRKETASANTSELLPLDDDDDGYESNGDKEASTGNQMIDHDYLPWPHDPPFPYPVQGGKSCGFDRNAALNPYVIVERALSFEVRTSPLNASAMVLLLKPLVPDTLIDSLQATAILRQHHARLMGMRLFMEAALLRKLCVPGWPGTRSLSRWGVSGSADYASITAPAKKNVAASYICAACNNPRDIDRHDISNHASTNEAGGNSSNANNSNKSPNNNNEATETLWRCERCKSVMAPCAVCGHRDLAAIAPLEDDTVAGPVLSTWCYCVGCSHGGHLSCIERWHSSFDEPGSAKRPTSPKIWSIGADADDGPTADACTSAEFSGGCCPLDGCGHACLPGQWRTELMARRSDQLARQSKTATSVVSGIGGGSFQGPDQDDESGVDDLDDYDMHDGQDGAEGPDGHGGRGSASSNGHGHGHTHGYGHGYGYSYGSGEADSSGTSFVRADADEVSPSRAVDLVRESLASARGELSAAATAGSSRSTLLSSSPGRTSLLPSVLGSAVAAVSGGSGGGGSGGGGSSESRERERRKSVKFAGTDARN